LASQNAIMAYPCQLPTRSPTVPRLRGDRRESVGPACPCAPRASRGLARLDARVRLYQRYDSAENDDAAVAVLVSAVYGYVGANPAHGKFVKAPAVSRDGKTVGCHRRTVGACWKRRIPPRRQVSVTEPCLACWHSQHVASENWSRCELATSAPIASIASWQSTAKEGRNG
jgi:hypothetical protein